MIESSLLKKSKFLYQSTISFLAGVTLYSWSLRMRDQPSKVYV